MKKAILATKVGMTQIFAENGELVPVTVLLAGPCVVTQVKTVENDGYEAVQVGFGDLREKLVNKPRKGVFQKAGVPVKRYIREFRFENSSEYKVADEIKADIFAVGDRVDATAITKGKGFQGAVKEARTAQRTHDARFKVPQTPGVQTDLPLLPDVFQGKGHAWSHGISTEDHRES